MCVCQYKWRQKIILGVYIDDGLIAATHEEDICKLISFLSAEFKVKKGEVESFLGLEIFRKSDGTIYMHQNNYAEKVIKRFRMEDAKPVSTRAEHSSQTTSSKSINVPYREAIGSLMYLAIATRPDIALGKASQFCENPNQEHWISVKRIIRYLKGTTHYGITFYNKSLLKLVGFSDADFAGDISTRRSTTGYVFMLGSGIISWSSEKQKSVSMSTTESEYIAASQSVKELIWLIRLLNDLVPKVLDVPVLHVDNQSAIKLIKNPQFHKRTKHIDVRYHFIREKYEEGIKLEYISTEDQIADILTKALSKDRFNTLRSLMNINSYEE